MWYKNRGLFSGESGIPPEIPLTTTRYSNGDWYMQLAGYVLQTLYVCDLDPPLTSVKHFETNPPPHCLHSRMMRHRSVMLQQCFWSAGSLTKSILCFVLAAAYGATALACEPRNRTPRCPAIACKPSTALGARGTEELGGQGAGPRLSGQAVCVGTSLL